MKSQDITYVDKLNELRLDMSHPNSNGKIFILLEGDTDIRLFRKFFNLQNCKVEKIPGGNPKVESAVAELLTIYELIIGIRDADFIHLRTIPYSKPNIFLTDFHDMEMSLVSENHTFSTIVFEFTDSPVEQHNSIRENIIKSIEQISFLKWLNEIENLDIVFDKTGFLDLISFTNFSMNFEQYFNRLMSKSPIAKITDFNTIVAKIEDLKTKNPNIYQLCNGHDFIKAFTQYLKLNGKLKSSNDDLISSIFRIKYSTENFQQTNLFTLTKHWGDSNNCIIHV